MKISFPLFAALLALPGLAAHGQAANAPAIATTVTAGESPELARARAELLEAYTKGGHDDDNNIKHTKAEIARLEYIAANTPVRVEASAPLFSIDFPGGSVSSLLTLIGKSGGDGALNIVGEKADLALDLPALSVRNADPAAFAAALDGILRPRGYTLESTRRPSAPNQASVYVLRKLAMYESNNGRASLFQAFQLAPYTESQSVDDIVSAIRTAWELDSAHVPDAMRLKFHPPTGILLVSCPPDGLNIVGRVLNELRHTAPPPPKAPPSPKTGVTPAAETR
jgi:hypothetical protein